jgi:long-chain acyl-CoA synthetase
MATQSGFENLVVMFEHSVKQYGSRDLFGTKKGGGWSWTTYAETGKLVDRFRAGLAALGIQKGDKICIVSNNRVEWAVACYACFGLGAALVPMYEAQLPKEWAFIAADCGAVALIAATPEIVAKWRDVAEKAPTVKRIVSLVGGKDDEGSFEWVLAKGDEAPVPSIQPSPKDVATLIYTSGTTGNPKGVILSHGNIVSNINAMQTLLQLGGDDRSLSFLPWAHSFGNTVELHGMTSKGASMALCPDTAGLIADLADVKPTVLMSVPRIFNKIYDGVNKQIAAKPALVQNLFKGGLKAATKQRKGEKLGLVEKATLAAADKLVFGTVREKFGGRLKYAFSGGSALSRDVAEFIDGLGITVYEGYGLTETSPIATANRPGAHRIGSVGQPIPDVKIVIDKAASGDPKHGEIVVYGPNVMQGYHARDEENKAVFTDDGGFRTGDLGFLDDDGFLYITGRIKEQYKLENGKYVAPAPLEEQLKLSPFVTNAMVYGDNRLFNVALIVPDMDALKKWASDAGISGSDDELVQNPKVKEFMQKEIDKASAEFKGFERVRKITLTKDDFTTQNGLLTPSLKLKRRVAWTQYGPSLEALYQEPAKKEQPAEAR